MLRKELISIIVPCYNEEESLPIFYNEINKISKEMKNVNFEFMFINDGSKDKTLEILRNLSKKDKRVRYISFSRNFGKEAGMYAGLKNVKGDYVAIMDADMQDPPSMIKTMYSSIKSENYDCVALYTKSHKGYNFIRKGLTSLWYKLIDRVSNTREVPGARDFRLMTRQMVDSILEMAEYNRYTKGIFGYIGFETKWIGYDAPSRAAGVSKFSLKKLIKYAMEGIVAFSTSPLTIATYLGIVFIVISLVIIITLIVRMLAWNNPIIEWLLLTGIITFISGIELITIGIIGTYLSKIYLEVKNRPVYIVKETEKMGRK